MTDPLYVAAGCRCCCRYTAHRRALPSGLTEYRSVTVIPDTSPLEYVDFSLDDNCRRVCL